MSPERGYALKSRRVGQNNNPPCLAEIEDRNQHIVYDAELLPGFSAAFFDPEYLGAEACSLSPSRVCEAWGGRLSTGTEPSFFATIGAEARFRGSTTTATSGVSRPQPSSMRVADAPRDARPRVTSTCTGCVANHAVRPLLLPSRPRDVAYSRLHCAASSPVAEEAGGVGVEAAGRDLAPIPRQWSLAPRSEREQRADGRGGEVPSRRL